MTDGGKHQAGAQSMHFLVDFGVYEFRSLVSIDVVSEVFSFYGRLTSLLCDGVIAE